MLSIHKEDIDDAAAQLEDITDVNQLADAVVHSVVRSRETYQSFAKTMAGIDMFQYNQTEGEHFDPEYELQIVIAANVSGLDIGALFYKYKDQIDEETASYFDLYETEEEVVAKFNPEYQVFEKQQLVDYLSIGK